jgi:hypothetical protein
MPSENTIYFFPGRGGHSHDGNNSSLIDTTQYSLFDFSWGLLGDPDRRSTQSRNYDSFKNFVVETVNSSLIEPAGLVLQPGIVNGSAHIISRSIEAGSIAANTLTANEISANTITSNELTANFVLVNTIIASNNFNGTYNANTFALSNTGTDGWAITSAGDAVFTNGFFRGSLEIGANDYWYSNGAFALGGNTGIYRNVGEGITLGANVTILGGVIASSVATPGIDIDSAGNLTANTFALYGNGAIVTSSGNFAVDASGNLSAESATLRGEISSDTFVTHNRFGVDTNYTRPTVLIDNTNNELSLNSTNGGLRIGANFMQRYTSGSSFFNLNWDFVNQYYYFAGTVSTDTVDTFEVVLNTGVKYYTSNLMPYQTQGVFPISFCYRISGGRYYLIANDDVNTLGTITWTASDRRIKENILPVSTDILDKFYSINVYRFNWNDKAPPFLDRELTNVGVIADELKAIIPDAVDDFLSDDEENNRWATVEYEKIVPYAIAAIQDLNSKIQVLEARIAELEG